MNKLKFYQIISDIIDKIAQEKSNSYWSRSYFKLFGVIYKANTFPVLKKHYSIFSLYILAKEWKIPVDNLFPYKENMKKLKQFSTMSDKAIEDYIKIAEKELMEDRQDEWLY